MKKFKFKDGLVITASTVEEAKSKHKVMASKTFTVYVGDGEVNDNLLSIEEARKIAKSYRNKGYDDVKIVDTKTNKVVSSCKITSTDSFNELMSQKEFRIFIELAKELGLKRASGFETYEGKY